MAITPDELNDVPLFQSLPDDARRKFATWVSEVSVPEGKQLLTIGKKGVLLLGRFTEGRIQILERLRDKLRALGFVPMVFNFDKPETKDFTETVRLLASLSQFVG